MTRLEGTSSSLSFNGEQIKRVDWNIDNSLPKSIDLETRIQDRMYIAHAEFQVQFGGKREKKNKGNVIA